MPLITFIISGRTFFSMEKIVVWGNWVPEETDLRLLTTRGTLTPGNQQRT